MDSRMKVIIVLGVLATVVVIVAIKRSDNVGDPAGAPVAVGMPGQSEASETATEGRHQPLPKIVDLGAGKCIPCKAMAPILEQLKADFARQFEVEFIDVWKEPSAGEAYGIRLIPTQIFLAPDGAELFRHEGFYSREQILVKWKDLGFSFDESADGSPQ